MVAVAWACRKTTPSKVDRLFRRLQLVSAAAFSLGHGGNDAQKTMGIIAVLLYSNGFYQEFTVPGWVILSCYTVMGLGTMLGGYNISPLVDLLDQGTTVLGTLTEGDRLQVLLGEVTGRDNTITLRTSIIGWQLGVPTANLDVEAEIRHDLRQL